MGRLTAIVLGSAAGGGFPQWNCRCPVCRLAWAGDARVRPRTQASLAVSADGEDWVLINASPDLPAQLRGSKPLHPRTGTRGSPIKAVVLTGARDRSGRRPAQPARARAVLHLCDRRDARGARRQPHVRRAGSRAGDAAGRRARRAARAPGRPRGRAVHGARQGPALSRRREPRHRERDGVECRRRDFGGRRPHRLYSGRGRRDRRDAGADRACRRGVFRRHALSRRRDDRERHRQQDRPPHGTHADRRRGRLARRARHSSADGASTCTSTTPIRSWSPARPSAPRSSARAGRSPRTGWRSCCEADAAGRARSAAARHRRAALSPPASVPRAAARRQVHERARCRPGRSTATITRR